MASSPGRIVESGRGARELYFEQETITPGLRSFDSLERSRARLTHFYDRSLPTPLVRDSGDPEDPLCLPIPC